MPIGIILQRTLAQKVGHKCSYLGCLLYYLIMSLVFIGVVHSPKHPNLTYLFSMAFGINFGWYSPTSSGYFCTLVPQTKVTELWGLNTFCAVILSWVPSIVFAALNEITGNMRVGWIGVFLFELIGLVLALTIPERRDTSSTDNMGCSVVDEEKGIGSDEEKGPDKPPPPVSPREPTTVELMPESRSDQAFPVDEMNVSDGM